MKAKQSNLIRNIITKLYYVYCEPLVKMTVIGHLQELEHAAKPIDVITIKKKPKRTAVYNKSLREGENWLNGAS